MVRKAPRAIMVEKRPKIKYAPKHWAGVFPAMVILFIALGLGAIVYIVPSATGLLAYNSMFSYLSNVANAQTTYHDKNDTYTTDAAKLTSTTHVSLRDGFGMTGKIVAACDDGWVAYATADFGKQTLYASSVSTLPQDLATLKLPSCVTAAELSGTTLDYNVTTSKVTVKRAPSLGATIEGAASPKKARESARLTWEATNSCSKGQTPTYRVRVLRQDLENHILPASSKTPRDYTTGKLTLDVSSVLNGITYKFQVSGRCGENYPYGSATTVTYTQPLPVSNGVIGRWSNGRLVAMYGKVATSSYVHYQLQVKKVGSTAWRTIEYDMNPTGSSSYRPSNYYASGGDLLRVRAFTTDDSVKSDWSKASQVRFNY